MGAHPHPKADSEKGSSQWELTPFSKPSTCIQSSRECVRIVSLLQILTFSWKNEGFWDRDAEWLTLALQL